MSAAFVFWRYQAILLLRNRFLMVALIFLVIAALYGASYGKHVIDEQQKVIYSVDTLQQRSKNYALETLSKKDTGNTEQRNFPGWQYYSSAVAGPQTVIYRPSAFSTLAIGQKDNFPFYHDLTGSYYSPDFYATISTDIQNPVKLLTGNFDLAFVMIYLLPLVIIAMGYNALSGEKETNTFTLLRIQTSVAGMLRSKLAFQATFIIALSVVINLLACLMNGINIIENAFQVMAWLGITVVYIVFWFAVVFLIASFNKSSEINALLSGGIWILLLLVMPSAVHHAVSRSHEKESVQSMLNQRGDYPQARDLSDVQLKDSFNRLKHPEPLYPMNDTGKAAEHFYRSVMANEIQIRANNSRGRSLVKSQDNEYRQAIRLNWLNPVFAVQSAYNQVAGTEINNYHNYLAAAEAYQTKRRYFLYQYSLRKREFTLSDYRLMPGFGFREQGLKGKEFVLLLLPVMVLALLMTFIAAKKKIL